MSDPRLTARQVQILKAIVDAHINNGEPVGSKYLSQTDSFACSPATIRNEMASLEQMGYLLQPHTSAGRVPSELAYRLYVDALIDQYSHTRREIEEIKEGLRYKLLQMDDILAEASRLAASFTDYTGIAFKASASKVRIYRFNSVYLSPKDFLLVMSFEGDVVKTKTVHLSFAVSEDIVRRFGEALNIYLVNLTADEISMPIIMKIESIMGSAGPLVHPAMKVIYEAMNELDSSDVKLDGINKLLQYPEYSDVSKLRSLLGVLEEKDKLMDVISSQSVDQDGIHVYIGTESDADAMSNTALVFKNVTIGNNQFAVGVIGPRRMNYSKVIDMVNQLAFGIDHMLNDENN